MARVFLLGGRMFSAPEHTTARQDAYMVAHAIEAGVMGFAGKRLDDESVVIGMMAQIFKSGRLEYLLAGGLVEDGKKWSAKEADANADFFGELTDPDAKQQLLNGIVEVLAHFFRGAPISSTPSGNALAETAPAPEQAAPATDSISPDLAAVGAA